MSDKAEWRIFDDGDREFTGDYDVWIGTGDPDSEEDGAVNDIIAATWREHARLIAAAPDMLAALTDCLAALTDPVVGTIYGDDPNWYQKVDAAADKARAAIAKATGQ